MSAHDLLELIINKKKFKNLLLLYRETRDTSFHPAKQN